VEEALLAQDHRLHQQTLEVMAAQEVLKAVWGLTMLHPRLLNIFLLKMVLVQGHS
jgi:hypothetical protein